MHVDSLKHKKAVRFKFFVRWHNKLKKQTAVFILIIKLRVYQTAPASRIGLWCEQ